MDTTARARWVAAGDLLLCAALLAAALVLGAGGSVLGATAAVLAAAAYGAPAARRWRRTAVVAAPVPAALPVTDAAVAPRASGPTA
ncbi:hypothetical protein [Kineococcus sp. SYSU DK004]|uniref:hypothetical protein n=1 Tax=Kineococcus sp. SYSU DK004 TaxID=3383125 RepID=UPI003D7EFCC6